MNQRLALPSRRNHISQNVRIANQPTLYISVHDDPSPAEIFLRVKGLTALRRPLRCTTLSPA